MGFLATRSLSLMVEIIWKSYHSVSVCGLKVQLGRTGLEVMGADALAGMGKPSPSVEELYILESPRVMARGLLSIGEGS